ncbi:MAG: hypothetical protein GEU98_24780 [Pseudonocardiaceae bacterium]|nr:hypothetical protein [Pseudonocardiaceae bacterium]
MAITAVVAAVGMLVDDRYLVGSPIWFKPFKFSVSFVLYAVTWAWMISKQHRDRRWASRFGTVIALTGAVEMLIIVGQTVRGERSHFNVATPLDSALWSLMAGTIVVLWVANLGGGILLLRERLADRPSMWAIRSGVGIALIGLALGFLMTRPTEQQLASDTMDVVGAHSVGVPDGGPSVPVTGWSTTGGDLRIPHFVGMHALQALPLFAIGLGLLARRRHRLRDDLVRVRLIWVAAGTYAGVVGLVTWQALRGQSLFSPDGWTLAALGVLLAAAAAAATAAIATKRRVPTREGAPA